MRRYFISPKNDPKPAVERTENTRRLARCAFHVLAGPVTPQQSLMAQIRPVALSQRCACISTDRPFPG